MKLINKSMYLPAFFNFSNVLDLTPEVIWSFGNKNINIHIPKNPSKALIVFGYDVCVNVFSISVFCF